MKARIVLSAIIASLLLIAACCGDTAPPVTPQSSALEFDAGPDADVTGDDGIGTSPSRPGGPGQADDDPTK